MAREKGFTRVRFTRLIDVLGLGDGDAMSKEEHLAKADTCRREMETNFLAPDFDLEREIRTNKDTDLTYHKYVKSALEDLRWGPNIDPEITGNTEKYAAETRRVARHMTKRLIVSLSRAERQLHDLS